MGGSTIRSRGGDDRDRSQGGGLPRTHPSGRREHAAGGASEDGTEETLGRTQKPAGVRAPAFKDSQRGVV